MAKKKRGGASGHRPSGTRKSPPQAEVRDRSGSWWSLDRKVAVVAAGASVAQLITTIPALYTALRSDSTDRGTVTVVVVDRIGNPVGCWRFVGEQEAPVWMWHHMHDTPTDLFATIAADGTYTFGRLAPSQVGEFVELLQESPIGERSPVAEPPSPYTVLLELAAASQHSSVFEREPPVTITIHGSVLVTAAERSVSVGGSQIHITAGGARSLAAIEAGFISSPYDDGFRFTMGDDITKLVIEASGFEDTDLDLAVATTDGRGAVGFLLDVGLPVTGVSLDGFREHPDPSATPHPGSPPTKL